MAGKTKQYIDRNDVIFKINPLAVKSSKVKGINRVIVEMKGIKDSGTMTGQLIYRLNDDIGNSLEIL